MEDWAVEQVCDFLVNNRFDEEVVGSFRVNKICGSVLWSLNESDMKELELTALGDRRRLQCLVKKNIRVPLSTTADVTELESAATVRHNYAPVKSFVLGAKF